MISVVCVLVEGNVPYTIEYVERLKSMVDRHLQIEHHVFCLTDRPKKMPKGVHGIEIKPLPGLSGWWSKLHLFNKRHGLRGPGLYLDLDVLIVADLGPIVRYQSNGMSLAPHDGAFEGRGGKKVVKKFNSSVISLDLGAYPNLWDRWSPAVAQRLWGDQDWIGEQAPGSSAMPLEWFPRLSQLSTKFDRPWGPGAKVVLCKSPKNHDAVHRYRWFDEAWG